MRVFCTNDDGVASPGLAILAAHLAERADSIVIAAPDVDMSGVGTAILRHDVRGGVHVRPHVYETHPHLDAHAVTGTPSMAVILAERGAFGPAPDVVVSGANLGANVGHDLHHSGTVGAAAAASRRGIHGVAVSLATDVFAGPGGDLHWSSAAAVGTAVVEGLIEHGPTMAAFVNVNVPNLPLEDIAGVRTVVPADTASYRFLGFDERLEADGARHLTPRFERENLADLATDVGALRSGFATITWLDGLGMIRPGVQGLDGLVAAVGERLGLTA